MTSLHAMVNARDRAGAENAPGQLSPGGQTPTHYAALNGHSEIVQLLVDKGAEVHAHDNAGKTALDLALQGDSDGHRECAEILREAMKTNPVSTP